MYYPFQKKVNSTPIWRDRTPLLGFLLVLFGLIIFSRLFYIQIIKHDSYKSAAVSEQLKKFSVPSTRGRISILDGQNELPVVLNESKFLIYADPVFVDDKETTVKKLHEVIGGDKAELERKLNLKSRYVEIIKRADTSLKNKVEDLNLKGIVAKEIRVRSYPQGALASQVLGFVNNDGVGQYGIEGWLDDELRGQDGLMKAVTDIRGVPLAGNSDNIIKQPIPGKDVVLTIDTTIQRICEDAIKTAGEKTKSTGVTAIVMDITNGHVKASANWPTYSPVDYSQVANQVLFKNRNVTDALEMGSIMKTLTIASAINQGLINKDSTYYDKGYEEVEGYKITNALNVGAGTFSIYDIVRNSLNSGAVYLLKLMGGGSINQQARSKWYDYMYNNYKLGQKTNIEQPGESQGIVPDPEKGFGLNVQYANTSFGQGVAITPVQMAAALGSVLNGGIYYQPTLIYGTKNDNKLNKTEPKIIKSDVVSKSTTEQLIWLLEQYVKTNNKEVKRDGFSVGGKTGTAQIPDGKGGYRKDIYDGAFAGFVGRNKPQYVVVISIKEPQISGFAGSAAARPIFIEIANGMMDSVAMEAIQ